MASPDLDKKKVLGRGLASLIPGTGPSEEVTQVRDKREFFLCDIEKIVPNTYQPRKTFAKEALEELVESIRTHGIIQPLLVRRRDNHFELIAGERRWRAAQRAGLKQVPVVIKEIKEDKEPLELAIIENIQREELNCIEEAVAYQQLSDEFQLSQEEIAERVGKSRASVANTMRLLKLPAAIREDLVGNRMTMGHARALLTLESSAEQLEVRELILKKKLSVRDTEKKVNELVKKKAGGGAGSERSVHLNTLEEDLRRRYGTQVRVVGNEQRGFIQLVYASRDDLMRLADMLKGSDVSQA